MRTVIIILIAFASCKPSIDTPTFSETYFTNSAWFASNKDSIFFKADTINLVRYLHTSGPNEFFIEDEVSYFDTSGIVRIILRSSHELGFNIYYPNRNYRDRDIGKYTWQYNRRDSSIEFYKNDSAFFCFIPLFVKEIKVKAVDKESSDSLKTKLLFVKRTDCR